MSFGPLNLPSFNLSEIRTDLASPGERLPAPTEDSAVPPVILPDGAEESAPADQAVDMFCSAGHCNPAPPSPNYPLSCSNTARMIASEGRAAMQNAKNAAEQCYIGEDAAGRIHRSSSKSSLENAIAEATLKSYPSLKNIESAVKLLAVSLGAIAGGVQGPVGFVLGRVGHDAFANAVTPDDRCVIGTSFCLQIANRSGDSTERKLAEAALGAYPHMGTSGSASFMLDRIMQSMSPWGYGPFEPVMGKTAVDIMDRSMLVKDRCAVGYSFTKTIMDNTASSSEKQMAQAALNDFAKSPDAASGAAVLRKYLVKFTSAPPVPPSATNPPPPIVLAEPGINVEAMSS